MFKRARRPYSRREITRRGDRGVTTPRLRRLVVEDVVEDAVSWVNYQLNFPHRRRQVDGTLARIQILATKTTSRIHTLLYVIYIHVYRRAIA